MLWTECLCPSQIPMLNLLIIPNVMVFGGGTFRRELGHEGGVLMNEISALIRKG